MAKQLNPQDVAVSVRNNISKRRFPAAIEWLKKLPRDVCLETLVVACGGLEQQVVIAWVEWLGFYQDAEYDVFAMLM